MAKGVSPGNANNHVGPWNYHRVTKIQLGCQNSAGPWSNRQAVKASSDRHGFRQPQVVLKPQLTCDSSSFTSTAPKSESRPAMAIGAERPLITNANLQVDFCSRKRTWLSSERMLRVFLIALSKVCADRFG